MIRLPFGLALGRYIEWTEAQAEIGVLENARDELCRRLEEARAKVHLLERLRASDQEKSQERSVLNPCD